MPTYIPKADALERRWFVIDASGKVLGKVATAAADVLTGKRKPIYTPFLDTGDHVVVVNADRVAMTGAKREDRVKTRYTGWPGGGRSTTWDRMMEKHPERVIELAVWGMLPKNRLGRKLVKKLKVYAGPTHPHTAQGPQPLDLGVERRQSQFA